MGFYKKTIREYDLAGKTVLLRADYNVPIADDGTIRDDYRIKKSLPSVEYLLQQNCRVVICSHLGRPQSPNDPKCTLKPVSQRLGELLNQSVQFAEDCVGDTAKNAVNSLQNGQVLLLENLRYHKEEEENNEDFARQLAELAEIFVQDGFGVVHRAHASTDAVTHYLPAVAGLLLEKEVDTITNVMENPGRPLMTIIGGAKISDKIEILKRFVDIADFVVVGGGMANTFLLAEGINIGKSLAEPNEVPLAKEIIEKARAKAAQQRFILYLPQDGVATTSLEKTAQTRIVDWDAHVIATLENYPNKPPAKAAQVSEDEMIVDVGPFSGAFIAGGIQLAETVIWNGTLGVTETPAVDGPIGPFAHGTEILIEALLGEYGHKPFVVVGGGDTAGYIEQRQLTESFNHVSTGGGASMELMSGKALPGVEALLNKDG
ncbi:MAG: phosphoglycerate kinase [Patescibacteria group bacterium]